LSNIHVYLAGPITGCTNSEANDWRAVFSDQLRRASRPILHRVDFDGSELIGVSPLRCEPIVGDIYAPEYDDNQFGNPQVIAAKNKEDVRRCDVTFAYLPATNPASVGTLQEIGWAAGMGKPIILVTDNDHVRENAVIKATVPWRFRESGEDGFGKSVEVIAGIFGVYL
jgi:nucleoside 2-deoxyribosyltransferase